MIRLFTWDADVSFCWPNTVTALGQTSPNYSKQIFKWNSTNKTLRFDRLLQASIVSFFAALLTVRKKSNLLNVLFAW